MPQEPWGGGDSQYEGVGKDLLQDSSLCGIILRKEELQI